MNSSQDVDYERVLLVKPTVYVYQIPPLTSASRGFKASDWNLAQPNWTGRLRLISKGDKCFLRIEDSSTGQLYCEAPVLAYPGPQVQRVNDSRRYYVVKVVSDTGRTALIGIGFGDGADSFDLDIALQDYFSFIDKANKIGPLDSDESDRPKLDLTLKGDIKLNIGCLTNNQQTSTRPRQTQKTNDNNPNQANPFFLPPPPSSTKRR